ncbi:hypothetical protein [Telmatospirillum siberiense]|uniref:Uncharacterized protein n=1 Tax=Telmatospirillum siberiense TaxID=382514 RepID=A0A2N3PNL1_9PROT|nr:hypothetical protein [Telmatospirillum siberiense]PKU21970.1 hypothetical protein CWS72_24000 [Telmatospirillum siberiense]
MPEKSYEFDIAATDNPAVAEVYEQLRWLALAVEFRPDEEPLEAVARFERLFVHAIRAQTLIAHAIDALAPGDKGNEVFDRIRDDLAKIADRISSLLCLREGATRVDDGESRLREARVLLEKASVMTSALERAADDR